MRVFVLGAGASRHAGYPLTSDLGPKLEVWAGKNPPRWNYRYWPDSEGQKEFGLLDDIEGFVTKVERYEKPEKMLGGLREAVCGFFDSIRANSASCYQQFASDVIRGGDVVITFNYDVSLELELRRARKWEVGNGYGFDLEIFGMPKSATTLLKLHGSTNWVRSHFGGIHAGSFSQPIGWDPMGSRPRLLPREFQFLSYQGVADPKPIGAVTRTHSMILMSRNKRFYVSTSVNPRAGEPFWSALWGQADTALRNAGEITVIGYSLPVADAEARRLLLETTNKHCLVTVCCGGDTDRVAKEFVRHGFSRVRSDSECFEEWLAVQCGQVAENCA